MAIGSSTKSPARISVVPAGPVIMMEGADASGGSLTHCLWLAAVHSSRSPALLEYRSP